MWAHQNLLGSHSSLLGICQLRCPTCPGEFALVSQKHVTKAWLIQLYAQSWGQGPKVGMAQFRWRVSWWSYPKSPSRFQEEECWQGHEEHWSCPETMLHCSVHSETKSPYESPRTWKRPFTWQTAASLISLQMTLGIVTEQWIQFIVISFLSFCFMREGLECFWQLQTHCVGEGDFEGDFWASQCWHCRSVVTRLGLCNVGDSVQGLLPARITFYRLSHIHKRSTTETP